MGRDPLSDLHQILAEERQAILTGQYEDLSRYALTKEDLLAGLSLDDLSPEALAVLRSSLDQNQALIGAALRGVKSAQARLAALRQVQQGLTIYDREGSVSLHRNTGATLEKKA